MIRKDSETDSDEMETCRLDKWLWHTRICKTRAVAAKLVSAGSMRVNSNRTRKPGKRISVGDGLSFAQRGQVRVITVLSFATARQPASLAQLMYREEPEKKPPGQGCIYESGKGW